MTTNREALNSTLWMQSGGREYVPPPLPPGPPPPSPPPPAAVPLMRLPSTNYIRFASTIVVRQEFHYDGINLIPKVLDEREVTYDTMRREFGFLEFGDGILNHVTIPCGHGCVQILGNRFIQVQMKSNSSSSSDNLSFYFYPTDVSAFQQLVAAVSEDNPSRQRSQFAVEEAERPERVPEESYNGGSPQLLEQSRDESNSTSRGLEISTPKTVVHRGVPQQSVKPTVTPTIPKFLRTRRSTIPVVKPKPVKPKPRGTGQPATSSASSSEFQRATSFETRLRRDKLQSYTLICSSKVACAKKETKKCGCCKTGDILHICMNCRYAVKLGELGQFQCCGKKCSAASKPAFLEELSGSSSLVFRCSSCGWSMKQVA